MDIDPIIKLRVELFEIAIDEKIAKSIGRWISTFTDIPQLTLKFYLPRIEYKAARYISQGVNQMINLNKLELDV